MVEDGAPLAAQEDSRRFHQTCGRFAVTVSPVTIRVPTCLTSAAIAASSGGDPDLLLPKVDRAAEIGHAELS